MAYNKTDWKNLPDTSTPISAGNLNKMEEGIYQNSVDVSTNTTKIGDLTTLNTVNKTTLVNAINSLVGTTLYDNSSGTTEGFTLSDSIANYSKIDIVVKTTNNDIYTTNTFYDPSGKNLEVRTGNAETGLTDYYIYIACTITISGTTATRTNNRLINLRNGVNPSINANPSYYNLQVVKVIGYK